MKFHQAFLFSLAFSGALAVPTLALAEDAAVDPGVAVTVQEPVPVEPSAPPSEVDELAAREAASQLDEFQGGGDSVVIGTSTVLLVLVVVLIVVLIL